MTEGILEQAEAERFLDVAQRLPRLRTDELASLNIALPQGQLAAANPRIF